MAISRDSLKVLIQTAGYHEDMQSFVRLYCENRISKPKADEYYRLGQAKKRNGIKCGCFRCNPSDKKF
jgi:hypothetical protein